MFSYSKLRVLYTIAFCASRCNMDTISNVPCVVSCVTSICHISRITKVGKKVCLCMNHGHIRSVYDAVNYIVSFFAQQNVTFFFKPDFLPDVTWTQIVPIYYDPINPLNGSQTHIRSQMI